MIHSIPNQPEGAAMHIDSLDINGQRYDWSAFGDEDMILAALFEGAAIAARPGFIAGTWLCVGDQLEALDNEKSRGEEPEPLQQADNLPRPQEGREARTQSQAQGALESR